MEGAEVSSGLSWSGGVKWALTSAALAEVGAGTPQIADISGLLQVCCFVCLFVCFKTKFLSSLVCILLHDGRNPLSFLGPEIVPGWVGVGATWSSGRGLQ